MKAPMLEAYAGFKWVMFHMVFLMEPFLAQANPYGLAPLKDFRLGDLGKTSRPKGLKLSGALGPPYTHFPYRARPSVYPGFR